MGSCCGPDGYADTFGSGFSRRVTRRFRRRGLDPTASRMVRFLAGLGVEGASVLEIGGGVGGIQVELLRLGAARSTNLELVDSYEADAHALASEAGVADRMTRRQLDIATAPDTVDPHDVVILHRVVCCYPDYERLLGSAAGHARRALVFSHPPRNLVSRAMFGTENVYRSLRGNAFRSFVHDPDALVAAAERGALRTRYRDRGNGWCVVGLAAAAP